MKVGYVGYTFTEYAAITIAACVIASAALMFVLKCMLIEPTYVDFIAGDLAWNAQSKFQDLVAPLVFFIVGVSSFLYGMYAITSLKQRGGGIGVDNFVRNIFYWSLPFFIAVAGLFLGTNLEKSFFCISAIGLFIIGISAIREDKSLSASTVGAAIFSVLLISLIPIETALVLGRLSEEFSVMHIGAVIKCTYIIAAAGVMIVLFSSVRNSNFLENHCKVLLIVGQIGLPSFILTLYPARLIMPDGAITKYTTAMGLKILLCAFIFFGIYDVIKRYLRFNKLEWIGTLFSPVAVFSLLVAVKLGVTIVPHVSADDYHFGESLIGWWSYLQGVVPYVGYIPAHGVIPDDFVGMIAASFYNGTAGSIMDASRLSCAMLAFVAYISLYRFFNSLLMASISILPLLFIGWGGVSYTALFITPFLCLWFSEKFLKNSTQWLGIWMVSAPLIILGVPAQGLLLVFSSGIITCYHIWRLFSFPGEREWRPMLIASGILIVSIILTPVASMLFCAVRYVLDNGSINQLVWGVPWKLGWSGAAKPNLMLELIRMSWMAIPFTAFCIIYVGIRRKVALHILPSIAIMCFSLLLIPYTMGRIDLGGVSRMGLAALLGWTILIPLIAWPAISLRHRPLLMVIVAGMSALLNLSPISLSTLSSAMSSKIASGPLRDGASEGLKNLGVSMIQDGHWNRLVRLNTLLNRELQPGEKFLDLSSWHAAYFYVNRLPPVDVTAPYNMVSLAQQHRAVDLMRGDMPKIALLEGGGLSLRNPILYRFVLENYEPIIQDGVTIGRLKKPKVPGAHSAVQTITLPISHLTDANWENGVSRHVPAFIVGDASLLSMLHSGDTLTFSNGQKRKIMRVSTAEQSVYLDGGAPLSLPLQGEHSATFTGSADLLNITLFERAFGIPDLANIPIAWGRSASSLLKKMTLVKKLDAPILTDEFKIVDGAYIMKIDDNSKIQFDFQDSPVVGWDAGLLRLEFNCSQKRAMPIIKVSWWGGDAEAGGFNVHPNNGVLIIPLDAYARWILMDNIQGFQLDVQNAASCGFVSIKNVALYQRNSVRD